MHDPHQESPPSALFPLLRCLAASPAQSVAALAARLGLTTAQVDEAMAAAAAHGAALVREADGVRLAVPFDALVAEEIARAMAPDARRTFDVHVVDAVGSTNADLRDSAAPLPSGRVLAAELQYAGRGRRGRGWTAPIGGGLAFSLLWKFPRGAAALSGLSLATGLAVARTLERLGAAGVVLKWPNDVLAPAGAGLAKLAGILIEIAGGGAGAAHAVIGIGINVRLGDANARIDQAATDLAALGVHAPRHTVLAVLLEELLAMLRVFEVDGFAPLAAEWNARHAYRGRRLKSAAEGADTAEGIAVGVDDDGALVLETPTGRQRVVSGEVSLRPAAPG